MSTSTSKGKKSVRKNASGQRLDPGWEHGIDVDAMNKKVECKYCHVIRSGGVYRLKHHLACTSSNAMSCPQVPEDVRKKMANLLKKQAEETAKKKKRVYSLDDSQEEEEVQVSSKKGKGAIDSFVMKKKGQSLRQTTLNENLKKEERNEVCQIIARFFYTSAISFNCVNNPIFPLMIKKIGDFGRGLKPPSYHEIRVTFFKKEVAETLNVIANFKEQWKITGCTIMSDGWSDRRRRSICNFLVNSPAGSIFLSSLDTSHISKTAIKIYEMLDEVVEKVGEDNVIQIVTDNASNYKLAGEMLMQRRKKLFWTPCAAHCIDLMLEDFEKHIDIHRKTIAKARRRIVSFIYSRDALIHWMKEFTKGIELLRPAVTRFATSYLTLRRIDEQKGALISLFTSNKWKFSSYAKLQKGKQIVAVVLDHRHFWANVVTCLKAAIPLVKVLRLVDSDEKPAMGFIYEAMDRAKEQIQQNFDNVRKSYEPIWKIIDNRWEAQLHRPLHGAGYFLNPHFQYSPNFHSDAEVKIGLYECLQRMIPDANERVKIDLQMDAFKSARGLFGIKNAVKTRTLKSPADWWESYGDECPELKKFAIRILSLTCSSSGCECNWSTFEMVHSKRRNRLHQQRMNDLVFVMYNLKLRDRHMNRQAIIDPISLDNIQSDDEWITEREEPALPPKGQWFNVLDRDAEHDIDEDEDEVEALTRNLQRAYEEVHEVSDDDIDGPLDNNVDETGEDDDGNDGDDGDDGTMGADDDADETMEDDDEDTNLYYEDYANACYDHDGNAYYDNDATASGFDDE